MVELIPHGVYLLDGKKIVSDPTGLPSPDESRENTITYGILRAHDVDGGKGKKMRIRFDAMVSHDITYVGLDTDIPLEEFYSRLQELEPQFDADEKAAARSQCRQRYLAILEKDTSRPLGYRASIAVRNVPRNHPAFRILGTENAIIIRSAYHPYPLVIQGTGEGAEMAAGSVLNDILR